MDTRTASRMVRHSDDGISLASVPHPLSAPPERRDARELEAFVASLRAEVDAHPIWSCQLLQHCELGHLSHGDFVYLFSQYHRYSRDFTRYLAAVMASCRNDYYRSRLSQNLWEEGG